MADKHCNRCGAIQITWWKRNGRAFICNKCYKRDWYLKNRGPLKRIPMTAEERRTVRKAAKQKYADAHKTERKAYRDARKAEKSEYDKRYRKKNKIKLKLQSKKRFTASLQVRLAVKLRGRVKDAMRDMFNGKRKAGSAVRDLGCTLSELINWLESKFQPGMSWDNWGLHGWHIDHKIPLAKFDLTDRKQFAKACHYTNLQPLWAKENMSKGAKIV